MAVNLLHEKVGVTLSHLTDSFYIVINKVPLTLFAVAVLLLPLMHVAAPPQSRHAAPCIIES